MEKGQISTEIKKRIAGAPRGAIITIDSFPSHWSRGAVLKVLLRLCNDGALERHARGVYSKCVTTRFGKASASELEVISTLVDGKGKMFGGLFLFNALGLTTQNPSTVEILNNNSTYDGEIGNIRIHFRKIKPKITESNKPFIAIMEVVRELDGIADSNNSDVIHWIVEKTRKFSHSDARIFLSVAKEYPPRFRALLGAFIESSSGPLSSKIKETLKPTSVYKAPNFSTYVSNPSKWGLSFETA
jgi:hypothetical protein